MKKFKSVLWQGLGHDMCKLMIRGDVENVNFSILKLLLNEMLLDMNMFDVLVLLWVFD